MDEEAYIEFPATDGKGCVFTVKVNAEDWPAVQQHPWHVNNDGYVFRRASMPHHRDPTRRKAVKVYLHRELLGLPCGTTGRCRSGRIEGNHINRDKLDNRRHNLEPLTHEQNQSHWMRGGMYGPDKDYL